jgi:hypothetical protein
MRSARRATPSILAEPGAFTLYVGDTEVVQVPFAEIREVTFYKRDELTTDLICCDVLVGTGESALVWTLHKEMWGFDKLTQLLEELPASTEIGERVSCYRRSRPA